MYPYIKNPPISSCGLSWDEFEIFHFFAVSVASLQLSQVERLRYFPTIMDGLIKQCTSVELPWLTGHWRKIKFYISLAIYLFFFSTLNVLRLHVFLETWVALRSSHAGLNRKKKICVVVCLFFLLSWFQGRNVLQNFLIAKCINLVRKVQLNEKKSERNISNTRKSISSNIKTAEDEALPNFFNQLWNVWISDETLFRVFDRAIVSTGDY